MTVQFEVRQLSVDYRVGDRTVAAVEDVHLKLPGGAVHCIVGESGSGKSTLALALAGLLPTNASVRSGEAILDGQPLGAFTPRLWKQLRGQRIGFVFQDPFNALHPLYRIKDQMIEAILRWAEGSSRSKALDKAEAVLSEMGIADTRRVLRAYPHELSGGLRQRVVIGIAVSMNPDIIVCDEPTTALDVTIQRKILVILRRLADQGKSVLLITHDLGVVAQIADTVSVMYQGCIVENTDVRSLFWSPRHEYTRSLLASAHRLSGV